MTSIQGLKEIIKGYTRNPLQKVPNIPDDLFLGLIIVLVAFGSFGLGRLSKIESSKAPVRFENIPESQSLDANNSNVTVLKNTSPMVPPTESGELVGSKNGTKYYYSWCSGVQKISPANLIHFTSKEEAEARGYTASATCKGL